MNAARSLRSSAPAVWPFFIHMLRNGALKPPKIDDPVQIGDGDVLDVPGRPRVVHTPGHTPGMCSFHFESRRALFVGDLLGTWNPLAGRRGPQIMPAAFNVSSDESLASLGTHRGLGRRRDRPGSRRALDTMEQLRSSPAHARQARASPEIICP